MNQNRAGVALISSPFSDRMPGWWYLGGSQVLRAVIKELDQSPLFLSIQVATPGMILGVSCYLVSVGFDRLD